MSKHAYAKKFDGFLIDDDPDTSPKALAEIFCDMMANEQAAFLNMVARLSAEWPRGGLVFQWRAMEDHLDQDARAMLKEMLDHTEKEAAA